MDIKTIIELLAEENIKVFEIDGCLVEETDEQEYYSMLKKEENDWKFIVNSRGNKTVKELFKNQADAFLYFFLYQIKHKKIVNDVLSIKRDNFELVQGGKGINGIVELFRHYGISKEFYDNEVGYSVNIEQIDDLYNIYVVNPNKEKIYESKKLLNEKNLCLVWFNWTFAISIFLKTYSKYLASGLLTTPVQDTDVIFMINPQV